MKIAITEKPQRYQVLKGSESAHCCFEYTVLDTLRTQGGSAMCECFYKADAEKICEALNKLDGSPS